MEKRMYKFPEIGQFREAIQQVARRARYIGKDENNKPIYDESLPLPTLNYRGTVKLHGTNAGIVFTPNEDGTYDFHAQSKTGIITPTQDNMGFAAFVHSTPVITLMNILTDFLPLVKSEDLPVIKVFGEWCGKKIQKKVAISELDKMFVIFGVKVDNIWLSEEQLKLVKIPELKIYNICDYPSYKIAIDFNNPKEAAEKMAELVSDVEKECPVAKAFGVSGVGEGIVWTCIDEGWTESRFWFKTKGDEHKGTKTKEKVPVDTERVENIRQLVETIVAEPRLLQGLDYLREKGLEFSRKNLGEYLKWVYNDVIKEELQTIMDNGFEPKEISSAISKRAREWFFKMEDSNLGI
jgi:hypothetical protein